MLCLTRPSDPAWIDAALSDLDAVLVDHAHCEMKAASNAMALAVRAAHLPHVVRELALLAEEELRHFRQVLAELDRRGLALGPPPVDPYAATLRKLAAASGKGGGHTAALIDRFLVAALIEARSCERFRILERALAERGGADELRAFYADLLAAEARHFRTFTDLAIDVAGGDEARVRARDNDRRRTQRAAFGNPPLRHPPPVAPQPGLRGPHRRVSPPPASSAAEAPAFLHPAPARGPRPPAGRGVLPGRGPAAPRRRGRARGGRGRSPAQARASPGSAGPMLRTAFR
jgi:tRNA-(ms[2]io[6]A)-hydroxylase